MLDSLKQDKTTFWLTMLFVAVVATPLAAFLLYLLAIYDDWPVVED